MMSMETKRALVDKRVLDEVFHQTGLTVPPDEKAHDQLDRLMVGLASQIVQRRTSKDVRTLEQSVTLGSIREALAFDLGRISQRVLESTGCEVQVNLPGDTRLERGAVALATLSVLRRDSGDVRCMGPDMALAQIGRFFGHTPT